MRRARGWARLRQASDDQRISPPLVSGRRHNDFGVGEHRSVGLLLRQTEDGIGVEVRDQDCLDASGIDIGGHRLAGNETRIGIEGLHLAAASGVAENRFAVQLDGEHGDRNRHEFSGQASIGQGLFCLSDSRVNEVLRIMHFLPNAVIQAVISAPPTLYRRKLGSDLASSRHWLVLAWHGRGRRLLAFFRRDQSQTSVQGKSGPAATAAEKITSRRDVVGISAPLKSP
jgi:hypothetical protein